MHFLLIALLAASFWEFARYLADVVRHFHDVNGVTLSYVSPMNEPDYTFAGGGQEGMAVPVLQQAIVVQALGHPRTAVLYERAAPKAAAAGGAATERGRWGNSRRWRPSA